MAEQKNETYQFVEKVSEPAVFYGEKRGDNKSFDVTKGFYVRSGEIIDSFGSTEADRIGGNGGNGQQINEPILSLNGIVGIWDNKIVITELVVQTAKAFLKFGGGGKNIVAQRSFMIMPGNMNMTLTQVTCYSSDNYIVAFSGV